MKTKGVLVKMSAEEKVIIEQAASIQGLPTATYLRKLALDDARAKGFSLSE